MDKNDEILTRAVSNIIPSKRGLENLLKSGKKLNIYLGIDPTSTKIHLGNAVTLKKLTAFARQGHNVTLVIGDFTATIGDTSDKDSERPVLTKKQIEENFKTYKKQADLIFKDQAGKITIRKNSEWLSGMDIKKVIELCAEFSLNDFIGRELIKKRLSEGKNIRLHEVLYPVIQAYDSLMLDTDIQIGGTDQTFNIQAGRTLIKRWKNKESFVLTTPILEGTDGRKMSKTLGNAIWLEDSPNDIYAKVMSINDDLIATYFTLVTDTPIKKIEHIKTGLQKGQNPMGAKKQLAYEIVLELYGSEAADNAQSNFEKTVQRNELPETMETHTFDIPRLGIIDILTHLPYGFSASEAKRLIEQKGISIDGNIVEDSNEEIKLDRERLLKVGKRRVVKIISK